MNECLNCKKEYPGKRPHSKFCSVKCRVMYNRKNPKQSVTPVQMQVLYNSMLELIEKAKSEPIQPYFGVVTKDEVKWGETLKEPVKTTLQPQNTPTFQQLMNHISTLIFSDDKNEMIQVVRKYEHLTDKQKELLIINLMQ